MQVTVRRQGQLHRQRFERRGRSPQLSPVRPAPPSPSNLTLKSSRRHRLRLRPLGPFEELAYLNGGCGSSSATGVGRDEEEPHEETYFYEGGIKEYVAYMNKEKDAFIGHHLCEFREGRVRVRQLQWCSDAYSDSILGTNNIRTVDGGTHIEG